MPSTSDTNRFGELIHDGGRPQLRFLRRLPHPPAKVWRALTETEHLAAWFPCRIIGDFVPQATLHYEFDTPGIDVVEGKVLAVEPERVLAFTWGPDTLRFELRPDGDGTVLTLLDTLEAEGKAARDGAGWHECLDQLELDLAGAPPLASGGRWQEVHPHYVEHFGPSAATIGPPPGNAPGEC